MFDVEKYRHTYPLSKLEESDTLDRNPKGKMTKPFIKGPIPMDWFLQAMQIPRRNAIAVGMILFYLSGLQQKKNGIVLTYRRCKDFGLERKFVSRGLKDLEKSGLIHVSLKPGQSQRVDILSDIDLP
jgi:hypothetical protein